MGEIHREANLSQSHFHKDIVGALSVLEVLMVKIETGMEEDEAFVPSVVHGALGVASDDIFQYSKYAAED